MVSNSVNGEKKTARIKNKRSQKFLQGLLSSDDKGGKSPSGPRIIFHAAPRHSFRSLLTEEGSLHGTGISLNRCTKRSKQFHNVDVVFPSVGSTTTASSSSLLLVCHVSDMVNKGGINLLLSSVIIYNCVQFPLHLPQQQR